MPKLARAVLLIIDVQKAIDASYHAAEGPRNNPDAERKIAQLLSVLRREKEYCTVLNVATVLPGW